ncbi:hypothetical protein PCANC_21829 [Puccinia coronata f. sp. avenae]|uniref:Uncharacterized protein n=1 Tax=Puccinia coronata f. sp. avenae TaxID=200324 RepID=A0A2N5S1G8_9BASI|nr:hypothetical protein PCANC_21829 [Puccinia coronata f. sp. avenae]
MNNHLPTKTCPSELGHHFLGRPIHHWPGKQPGNNRQQQTKRPALVYYMPLLRDDLRSSLVTFFATLSAHNPYCYPCAMGSLASEAVTCGAEFHKKAALSNQSELVNRLSVVSTMLLWKSDHLSVAFTSVYNEIPYPAIWIQPNPKSLLRR